jgi:hypothetical protein
MLTIDNKFFLPITYELLCLVDVTIFRHVRLQWSIGILILIQLLTLLNMTHTLKLIIPNDHVWCIKPTWEQNFIDVA